MAGDFADVFEALKPVFGKCVKRLVVKKDTATEYTLVTKRPSPYPQHKGQPMFFCLAGGRQRVCDAALLTAIYMNGPLEKSLSPELKKRKRGKGCFNFKSTPDAALLTELKAVVAAGMKDWDDKKWI